MSHKIAVFDNFSPFFDLFLRQSHIFCIVVGLLALGCSSSKSIIRKNEHGLEIVKKPGQFQYFQKQEPEKRLVRVGDFIPGIKTRFYYATTQNFTGQVLYRQPELYLRKEAAEKLLLVKDSLEKLGLGILVFDGYRPYRVTQKMWSIVPDDRYAANPANGSGHNRGVSVDLTLTHLADGRELEMPTGYDNFSDTAHYAFSNLPNTVLNNRTLLKGVMEHYGFKALSTEWWHFGLADPKRYHLIDLDFRQLKKLVK